MQVTGQSERPPRRSSKIAQNRSPRYGSHAPGVCCVCTKVVIRMHEKKIAPARLPGHLFVLTCIHSFTHPGMSIVDGGHPRNSCCCQILLVMFAGMLAFDVLDRLTGDWSVTNTDWFQGFYAAVIQVWHLRYGQYVRSWCISG